MKLKRRLDRLDRAAEWLVAALRKVKLRIHQDIVFNTSTVLDGETVLVPPRWGSVNMRAGVSARRVDGITIGAGCAASSATSATPTRHKIKLR